MFLRKERGPHDLFRALVIVVRQLRRRSLIPKERYLSTPRCIAKRILVDFACRFGCHNLCRDPHLVAHIFDRDEVYNTLPMPRKLTTLRGEHLRTTHSCHGTGSLFRHLTLKSVEKFGDRSTVLLDTERCLT